MFYVAKTSFCFTAFIFTLCLVGGQPTLRCLLTELDHVTDWFLLGIFLEIDKDRLTQIQENFPRDSNRCKIEMLGIWLKSCPQPTWDKMTQAALDAKEENVAKAIRQKYCKVDSSSSAEPGI